MLFLSIVQKAVLALACVVCEVSGWKLRRPSEHVQSRLCRLGHCHPLTAFAKLVLAVKPGAASFSCLSTCVGRERYLVHHFVAGIDSPQQDFLDGMPNGESNKKQCYVCKGIVMCDMREKGGDQIACGEDMLFDVTKSTEDNYAVSHFTGRYAHIRPLLDYTWHRKYHPSRVDVQDELIAKYSKPPGDDLQPLLPWVVFTAGAMGVGKGYVRQWMSEKGYLPLERFVTVDPDTIREALPEWPHYVKANPETAGQLTQKEAGCIAEIIGFVALHDRRNVIFDGSLRNLKFYKGYFHRLRQNFPGIRIAILHVTADQEVVLKRAEERGKRTGRVVPRETLIESMETTPKSVQALSHFADFVCRIRNNEGKEPVVGREPGAPNPPESIEITWSLFKKLWMKLDTDGDGALTREDVRAAIASGILTEDALATVDLANECQVSQEDVAYAKKKAAENAELRFK